MTTRVDLFDLACDLARRYEAARRERQTRRALDAIMSEDFARELADEAADQSRAEHYRALECRRETEVRR